MSVLTISSWVSRGFKVTCSYTKRKLVTIYLFSSLLSARTKILAAKCDQSLFKKNTNQKLHHQLTCKLHVDVKLFGLLYFQLRNSFLCCTKQVKGDLCPTRQLEKFDDERWFCLFVFSTSYLLGSWRPMWKHTVVQVSLIKDCRRLTSQNKQTNS